MIVARREIEAGRAAQGCPTRARGVHPAVDDHAAVETAIDDHAGVAATIDDHAGVARVDSRCVDVRIAHPHVAPARVGTAVHRRVGQRRHLGAAASGRQRQSSDDGETPTGKGQAHGHLRGRLCQKRAARLQLGAARCMRSR